MSQFWLIALVIALLGGAGLFLFLKPTATPSKTITQKQIEKTNTIEGDNIKITDDSEKPTTPATPIKKDKNLLK